MEERDHDALVHTFIAGDGEFMLRVLFAGRCYQWALTPGEIARLTATCDAWRHAQEDA